MALMFKDAYATFWSVEEEKEKFARVKISTGDKQKDGSYVNTNWFATFVGRALDKIDHLEAKDKIKISGKVSNPYNKETKKAYLNVLVFDFEFSDPDKAELNDGEDSEKMPF